MCQAHAISSRSTSGADRQVRGQARRMQGSITVKRLDLADLTTVRACAEDINASETRLDLLILNAGVMMTPKRRTAQGLELQMGTNHFGHFYLTQLLLEKIKQTVLAAAAVAPHEFATHDAILLGI